jgi:hypothetical protein
MGKKCGDMCSSLYTLPPLPASGSFVMTSSLSAAAPFSLFLSAMGAALSDPMQANKLQQAAFFSASLFRISLAAFLAFYSKSVCVI